MGLDYSYKLYIAKQNLISTMQELRLHVDQARSGFEIIDDDLIKIERFRNRTEKIKLSDFGLNQKVDSCILFEPDEKIVEYYLYDLTRNYQPDSNNEADFLNYYQIADGRFWVGNIELDINDYSDKIPDTIELVFWAVTSDMSLLFAKSGSVDRFFKQFCKKVNAHYGCIYMEDAGYRLIWAKAQEYNLTIPINWPSFQDNGFIPVVRDIMKI